MIRTERNEKEALQDLAGELILYMKEYEDGDAFDMVQSVIDDFNLDLEDEMNQLRELFERN